MVRIILFVVIVSLFDNCICLNVILLFFMVIGVNLLMIEMFSFWVLVNFFLFVGNLFNFLCVM